MAYVFWGRGSHAAPWLNSGPDDDTWRAGVDVPSLIDGPHGPLLFAVGPGFSLPPQPSSVPAAVSPPAAARGLTPATGNLAPVIGGTSTTAPVAAVVRASTGAADLQANKAAGTLPAAISPDGTKVLFESQASNLTAGSPSSPIDTVYVKDLTTGAITLLASAGSFTVAFSPDGTKAAFTSFQSNLVAGDTNSAVDIFLQDLNSNVVTRASTGAGGAQANGNSAVFQFSADGTKIVFRSSATNLVAGDTNASGDIFVKDLNSGAITRASTSSAGAQSNGDSSYPAFSPDGTKVVFRSLASNLVAGDTNGVADVFVKDLNSGVITRVSTNAAGAELNDGSFLGPDVVFSPDGGKVVFHTRASNMVVTSIDGTEQIYLKDLNTGAVTLLSSDANGAVGDGDSFAASFSADGSKVVFFSTADNLVAGDTNGVFDIFVKDLNTGAITRIFAPGLQGDGDSIQPQYSADGSKIVFGSSAANLAPSDTNNVSDTFVASMGYVAFGAPVAIAAGLTLSDADSASLAGATVTISNGYQSGDVLSASTAGTAITASYDSGSHVLTLSGSDTVAHYQAVLRSVSFANSSNADPAAAPTRTFTWQADDGAAANHASNASTTTINVYDFVNSLHAGTVAVTGTLSDGHTLTADTSGLSDADGLGALHYQWQYYSVYTDAFGAANVATTNVGTDQATYDLTGSDVGTRMRLIVSYTDGHGTAESAISAITGAIAVDQVLTGDSGDNEITGDNGDDTLYGLGGNDTLSGGAGNDTLYGGTGDDTYVVLDNDTVVELSNEGTDTVQIGLSSYTVPANVENLTFIGTGAFTGIGSSAANVLIGGAGNDTLLGLDGADDLIGGSGNDYLIGGNGDDRLEGGTGNDTLQGGDGTDTYLVDGGDSVVEFANEGNDAVQTALAAYTLPANVENLTFVGTGDFIGVGSADDNVILSGSGNDTLIGGAGNDYLSSGSGDDRLEGGTGNDTLQGGTGNDTYLVDGGDSVVEFAGEGNDVVQTALAAYTLPSNVENLTYVGSGDFIGVGSADDNVILSGNGNDTLIGGAGNDTLSSGAGDDRLEGGTGNDTLQGGTGNDTYLVDGGDSVVEFANEGTDTVQTALASYTLPANVENLTYTGAGDFVGTGSADNNVIIGGNGNDTLSGAGGNDTLLGGAGDDTLDGGSGNDALQGGTGNDTYVVDAGDGVVEFASEGTDTVRTALASYTLGANVENLTYTGSSAFAGTGNGLDNVIVGGAGNDTLTGGTGNDTLSGGAGNDQFVFAKGDGLDIVTDFTAGDAGGDVIALGGYGVANFAALQPFMSQAGADVLIAFDAANHITLQHVTLAQLNAGDFTFA